MLASPRGGVMLDILEISWLAASFLYPSGCTNKILLSIQLSILCNRLQGAGLSIRKIKP